jgi:hypothetical protein
MEDTSMTTRKTTILCGVPLYCIEITYIKFGVPDRINLGTGRLN